MPIKARYGEKVWLRLLEGSKGFSSSGSLLDLSYRVQVFVLARLAYSSCLFEALGSAPRFKLQLTSDVSFLSFNVEYESVCSFFIHFHLLRFSYKHLNHFSFNFLSRSESQFWLHIISSHILLNFTFFLSTYSHPKQSSNLLQLKFN